MKKSSLAVIALFLLLYILPLGVRPIIIPDESRYAEIPREMLALRDWVVPHLNGLRYFEKPVLGYWVNAASIILFGENAFAIRLPSAMAAGISALMLFLLVRRFAGGYSAGILATVVFLTCLEVFGVGTFSVLDSLFSTFVTVAMVSFFFASMADKTKKRMIFLVLFGVFCGLAFLTKGFIAFAIPVVSIVPFLIWERRWKELFKSSWVSIVACIMVALPWSAIIYLREPEFWHYFFWTEHIKRFMSDHSQHPYPFWFFIPVLIVGALPWTVLFPAVISGLYKRCLQYPVIRFAICWFLFPFLFFSASHGKLGTYILPCFPPLAILIAVGLLYYFEEGEKRAFTIGALLLAMVVGTIALTLVISQVSNFPGLRVYGPSETWKWVLGVTGLLTWTALLVRTPRVTNFQTKLVLYCTAPVLFMFIAHFILPDQSKEKKAPDNFLLRHSHRIRPDTILVSRRLVPAVCWFYKRMDIYILRNGGELNYGLSYDDSRHRLLTINQFKKLIAEAQEEKKVVLITDTDYYSHYKSLLPKPIFEDIDGQFVFAQF